VLHKDMINWGEDASVRALNIMHLPAPR